MERYTKVREVGSGTFGKAVLVKDPDGAKFIMKVIDISRMTEKEKKDADNEVMVLSAVKHPYIINYRESFKHKGRQLCIVMDYAEGGDLFTRIQKQKSTGTGFSEQQILRWFTQAALALKYLHDKHILHRDLKSQNFFLSGSGRLRLGDFGISKVLAATCAFAKTSIGTPYYLSPEICQDRPYSWSSDIWSLGCVLFEMAALKVPFDASNLRQLVDKIVKGPTPSIPSQYSSALRQLGQDLLNRDWRKRPSAADVLQREVVQLEIRRMLKEEHEKRKVTSFTDLSKQTSMETVEGAGSTNGTTNSSAVPPVPVSNLKPPIRDSTPNKSNSARDSTPNKPPMHRQCTPPVNNRVRAGSSVVNSGGAAVIGSAAYCPRYTPTGSREASPANGRSESNKKAPAGLPSRASSVGRSNYPRQHREFTPTRAQ
eukprot:GHVL01042809.1.p1 GENE.GHVL01042809.1~~GHVL01042809.1.p1  ORF type:complete len:427 (+),score=79.22 GHVL01042809.1:45-1325(+)